MLAEPLTGAFSFYIHYEWRNIWLFPFAWTPLFHVWCCRCCCHSICNGAALNRYPNLKSFLVQGEAEYYEGVSVNFVKGRKAILKVYDGEEEVEEIDLQELNDKDKLHALLQEKGFKLRDDLPKSLEELRAENEAALEQERKEREELRARRAQEKVERTRRSEEEVKKREEAKRHEEAVEAVPEKSATEIKAEGVATEL